MSRLLARPTPAAGALPVGSVTWCTRPALLAAALLSAVLVLPFLPAGKARPLFFALEARLASTVEGVTKIYYDIGRGYNEVDAAQIALIKTASPHLYRFPLPPGDYRRIRFDATEGAGQVTLAGPLRLVSARGRVVRTVPLAEVRPLQQIETWREELGRLVVMTTPEADDPQLAVEFSPPLLLAISMADHIQAAAWPFLSVFGAIALLLLAFDRWPRLRTRATAAAGWLRQRPMRAVALIAAVAVTMSAYPVVFLGKSYVSPNFATTLLYGAYPTLPGYASNVTSTGNGSDMGATMWQHVPYSFIQRRALAQGELPLWNRYNSAGTPLLAQGQSMFGDPLHLLVVLGDGAAWAWDLKFLLAKWLLATGLGLTVLAIVSSPAVPTSSPLFVSPGPALSAALIVACSAPFIGFFHYRINHAAIFSLSYAPWVLYCWLRIGRASTRRPITLWCTGLFVANLALMNSGTVKEAYLLLAQMNVAGACLLLVNQERWPRRLLKLAAAAWAGVLLTLITAPIWGTFLPTLRNAFTVSMSPNASQLQPALLLGAFDELFFRPLNPIHIVFDPSLNFLLLLGVLYFLATLRLHFGNRTAMALAVCAVGTLAFAFGLVPPRWIVRVPLLANVGHIENCFLCGFIVLGAVLAGLGFAAAATRWRTPPAGGDLAISGVLLFALVSAWIGFGQAGHRDVVPRNTFSGPALGEALAVSPFVWGSLASLLLASVGLALLVRRGTFRPATVMLAMVCGIALLWRHGMHVSDVGFEPFALHPPARASFHVKSPAVEFLQDRQRAEPFRVFGLHNNLTPGWNAVYGLEGTQGPDALQNRWLRQLIDVSPLKWNSSWQLYSTPQDAEKARPFLDALNVRYYLDHKTSPTWPGATLQLAHRADLNLYESASAWPRAFFTTRLDTHTDPPDLMARFLSANPLPFASMARAETTQRPELLRLSAPGPTPPVVTPATHYRLTENTTAFDVHASGPGVVVLTEAWWPDAFRASVDGRQVPILRVNHAFKGVLIETPGAHRVTFWYWPRHFLRRLGLSAGGLALFAVSLFLGLRPRRPRDS